MPGRGTRNRTIRVPDDEWEPAQRKAEARGETITEVIRRALRAYNSDDSEPPRPE